MHVKNLYWLIVSVFVIMLDQWTKNWVVHTLVFHQPWEVIPGCFNLFWDNNTGAAFSFLAHYNGWQRWFFVGVALVICGALIHWLMQLDPKKKYLSFAIVLIIGGALGNLIDRVRFSYVVDFLQVYYQHYYWPTFNIADSAVVLGACLLGASVFFNSESSSK